MQDKAKPFAIALLAFVVALVGAWLALSVMLQDQRISLYTGLPRAAMTVPMLAVVLFWGVVRIFNVPLDPMRTFVLGAIAVYSLLYFCGRLIALSYLVDVSAIVAAGLAAFLIGFWAVWRSIRRSV